MVFGELIVAGFVGGGTIYLAPRVRHRQAIEPVKLMECCATGALIGAGVHLVVCGFNPNELVHRIVANGQLVNLPPGAVVEVDMLHRVHIAAAGVVTAVLALVAVIKMSRLPRPRRR